MTLNQQIDWARSQVTHLTNYMPQRVADGTQTPEQAAYRLGCARAVLATLRKLRCQERRNKKVIA